MMREIKFRAWIDDSRGRFMDYEPSLDSGICTSVYINDLIKENGANLMQFTGLRDKNGKEIYEGDVVIEDYFNPDGKRERSKTRVVEWDTVNPCFVLTNTEKEDDWEYDFDKCGLTTLEVIGNIYEKSGLPQKEEVK